jgi:hypothetical protein
MTPKRVVPAIDVDGVVADFAVHACGKLDLDINTLKTYAFADSFGPEVGALLDELIALPETWVQLKPFPDAPEQIARLTTRTPQGYIPFVFLSAVPTEFYYLRRWWLWYYLDRHHDIGETTWHLIASRRKDKPQDCLQWGVTHLLEDNPYTAAACQALGVQAYVLPRPYNEGMEPGIPRATLREFVDLVLTEAQPSSILSEEECAKLHSTDWLQARSGMVECTGMMNWCPACKTHRP